MFLCALSTERSSCTFYKNHLSFLSILAFQDWSHTSVSEKLSALWARTLFLKCWSSCCVAVCGVVFVFCGFFFVTYPPGSMTRLVLLSEVWLQLLQAAPAAVLQLMSWGSGANGTAGAAQPGGVQLPGNLLCFQGRRCTARSKYTRVVLVIKSDLVRYRTCSCLSGIKSKLSFINRTLPNAYDKQKTGFHWHKAINIAFSSVSHSLLVWFTTF